MDIATAAQHPQPILRQILMSILKRVTLWLYRTRNPQINTYFRDKVVRTEVLPKQPSAKTPSGPSSTAKARSAPLR